MPGETLGEAEFHLAQYRIRILDLAGRTILKKDSDERVTIESRAESNI